MRTAAVDKLSVDDPIVFEQNQSGYVLEDVSTFSGEK
jgi:hypothetical protein